MRLRALHTSPLTLASCLMYGEARATAPYVKWPIQRTPCATHSRGWPLWGDLLLAFEHGGHCTVNDRSKGRADMQGEFDVESSSRGNHCKSRQTSGVERLPGAEMPVIYLSVAQPKSPLDMRRHVESITRKGAQMELRPCADTRTRHRRMGTTRAQHYIRSSVVAHRPRARRYVVFSGRVRTVPAAMPYIRPQQAGGHTLPHTIARRQICQTPEPTMYSNR